MQESILNNTFTIDTRTLKKNDVFIALKGENYNGANFAKKALELGASLVILEEVLDGIAPEKCIIVQDSLAYMQTLAREKFKKLQNLGVKTVSLTGSIGKTTTKELLLFLLLNAGFKAYANKGNFNNHIGMPLTILNAPFDINFLILEMGMNHKGEIAFLNDIANCDVKIITNISPSHIGNFGGNLQGIALAKAEILQNGGVLFTTHNLSYLELIIKNFTNKYILSSSITNIKYGLNSTTFNIGVNTFTIGFTATESMLNNFGIIYEVLKYFNIPVIDLQNFTAVDGRGDEIKIKNTIVINESYNASPSSMLNAIQTTFIKSPSSLLILGSMKELGECAYEEHKKIVDYVKNKCDVIFIGEEYKDAKNFDTVEDFLQHTHLEGLLKYDYILIKASNSVNLQLIIDKINN